MATNDFLPYAVGGSANVLTQSAYAGSTTLLANGLQSGIVPSNQINKTLRQPSIMAAVLGQLIADVTGQNATDDGTTATLEKNLASAMRGVEYGTDSGAANAYVITLSPAPVALHSGMKICFVPLHTNTGGSTVNVNGLGVLSLTIDGATALSAGQITINAPAIAIYDGSKWRLANPYTPPASGSVAGISRFATSAETLALSIATAAVTPADLGALVASTSQIGISRFGTNAEQLAGSLATVGCTPAGLASGLSLGLNGYMKLPGGLILQWGTTASIASGGNATVTLPVAFPNAALEGVSTVAAAGNLTGAYCGGMQMSATAVIVYAFGPASATYRYLVVGY